MTRERMAYFFSIREADEVLCPELGAICPQMELNGLFAFFEGKEEGTENDRYDDDTHK